MSRCLFASLVASAALLSGPALANDAYTTRIEPRPFYGATVTVEEGVRVFRPLPAQRHVIVNPGNATPLSIGMNDTRVIENSTSNNYWDGVPIYVPRTYGLGGALGFRGGHRY